ncbi:MAG TPA: hypothetical protein VKB90_12365 [Candidatus Acidoferrum sp.]|nr:hypothetical protein [Candidatus Acidoferrum sp.]
MYVVLGASGHTGAIVAKTLLDHGKRVRVVGQMGMSKNVATRICEMAGALNDGRVARATVGEEYDTHFL